MNGPGLKKYRLLDLIILLSLTAVLSAQDIGVVMGQILDRSGQPLQFVNVFFTDGVEGAMTYEEGHFRIETYRFGQRTLRISHIGFDQKDIQVDVSPDKPVKLTVVLAKALIEMNMVTVSASSFTMADEEGQTLTSLEVITTAGAAADIFRAIQTFPGVSQVDEGVGMFVRGGDVSETIVLLDQATLSHPYRYESDTGGFFGIISPFLLVGTYFSSGGFSAKFGNALSGVLAMESLGMPDWKSVDVSLGLAAISLGGSYPIIPDRLGVRFSGNYSDTEALFKVNGGMDRFENVPVSWDANLSAIYKYSDRGQFKLFNFFNQDDVGFYYESPTYTGTFISGTETSLYNLQWKHISRNKLLVRSSLSRNYFHQDFSVGNLGLDISDDFWKWRTDSVYPLSGKVKINGGFELDRQATTITGSIPENENDLNPNAPVQQFSTDYSTVHGGIYLEGELNFSQRFFTISGLRLDHLTDSNDMTLDPRFSIGYRLSNTQILKLAGGRYHQYPKAQYRDTKYGNPDLESLQANHYVVGYELKSELANLRAELYYKGYTSLPLEDPANNYASDGHGYAYGADFFLKGSLPVISGWISYSYLVAERKELQYLRSVPTDYDIRHSFTTVLKSMLGKRNSIGLTYRYTSGKPYTPAPSEWNTARLPSIQRLDFSWSFFTFMAGESFLVIYAAVSNLLDRQNIYGYIYSPDYSERTELKSTIGRNIYFGFTISLR